jgi:ABC-type dipeptide/oligopeptide/nickel transport system ATPase component
MDKALLEVRNLRISFRIDKKNTFEAVKGISFSVPRNATVALVGESGSGKSVSSLAVMGLLPERNTIIDPVQQRSASAAARCCTCPRASAAPCAARTSR